jgi:hypothetical protein
MCMSFKFFVLCIDIFYIHYIIEQDLTNYVSRCMYSGLELDSHSSKGLINSWVVLISWTTLVTYDSHPTALSLPFGLLEWRAVLWIQGIFAGSGSDFWKSPDPDPVPDTDPDMNKFSDKFRLEIFLAEICSKSIFMNQKVMQQRLLKYCTVFMAFTHTKKICIGFLLRPGSKTGLRRLDPNPTKRSGSDRSRIRNAAEERQISRSESKIWNLGTLVQWIYLVKRKLCNILFTVLKFS